MQLKLGLEAEGVGNLRSFGDIFKNIEKRKIPSKLKKNIYITVFFFCQWQHLPLAKFEDIGGCSPNLPLPLTMKIKNPHTSSKLFSSCVQCTKTKQKKESFQGGKLLFDFFCQEGMLPPESSKFCQREEYCPAASPPPDKVPKIGQPGSIPSTLSGSGMLPWAKNYPVITIVSKKNTGFCFDLNFNYRYFGPKVFQY